MYLVVLFEQSESEAARFQFEQARQVMIGLWLLVTNEKDQLTSMSYLMGYNSILSSSLLFFAIFILELVESVSESVIKRHEPSKL